MTSAPAGFDRKIVWCTSGLPVTSMMRSVRGSVTNSRKSVVTGMLKRRANSMPGAHGLTSATPRMDTVASPTNISSRARPPLPAPMMTTFVTHQTISSATGARPVPDQKAGWGWRWNSATFSKRAYCGRNTTLMVPTGPFRCFPMMTSVMFASSGGRSSLYADCR